ncbi:hypothetical protein DL96DRAFT_868409 [Flagelloscypha sp. PMI_526]|nr:hypothetical protein DL96DRAFT_868409 [Flagelloscypha sp. PMI_526]
MSRTQQDRATTERFTKILRELVKRPENKVCADCKKNDPRWASWNLGVFLCIRCSGIHRGMGTHISKVKSVDLDKWTPEQMESIQKWGNHLANLYWEAHLKKGHIPPDHKMESFIRSKYESKRWAREGPPPADPSTLDTEGPSSQAAQAPSQSSPPATKPSTQQNLFDMDDSAPAPAPVNGGSGGRATITQQPRPHQLLSASQRTSAPPQAKAQPPAPPAAAPQPQNDIFSLDFNAPAPPPTQQAPPKDMKNDIMSLFTPSAPAAQPVPPMGGANAFGSFGSGAPQQAQWGWGGAQPQQQQQAFGGGFGGAPPAMNAWGAPASPPAQPNVWGAPQQPQQQQQSNNLFGGDASAVWGGSASSQSAASDPFGSFATPAAPAQQKNDAFGDLWGSFK